MTETAPQPQTSTDNSRSFMYDGNAAAGILAEIFATEMTDNPAQCAYCGNQGALGTLLAFMEGPGIILRCPLCENIVMRIVQTPKAFFLDLRGATYLRLERSFSR